MSNRQESGDARLGATTSEPVPERPAEVEPFTFPAVARLELDELLEQLIDRANEVLRVQGRLRGLVRATQAIAADLDLPHLLQRIVEEARTLIGARYAALGVLGDDHTLTQFVHTGMAPDTVERIGQLPTGRRGLLGHLITDPRPLRLEHLGSHESSVGFPPGHPPMGSFLGVPVQIRGQAFGNLYLTEKVHGAVFTAEDEELALSLAAAAAAAIDNARLFVMVSQREHWLAASRSVTNALLDVTDRDEALQLVTRSVRAAAEADFAAVAVPDSTGELFVAAVDGMGSGDVLTRSIPPESAVGVAFRDRLPLVLDDLSTHDEVQGPIQGLGLGPVAVVPLSARDQVLGALVIGNLPGGRRFSSQDLQGAGDFATQAGLVLLVAAAQAAAAEVEMGEERARIARDLHDHAIQGIFAAGLGLNGIATRIGGADGARLVELVDQLDDSIKAIRHSIFALKSQTPGQVLPGLRSRVHAVTDDVAAALGFPPQLQMEGPVDSAVSSELADDLLAVLREALSNAARHASATAVEVNLTVSEDVVLEVRDNGRGIGQPTRASGLANMSVRAQGHGGDCVVAGADGEGTLVRWVVPLLGTPDT
jgi:signal transduction histidine kinase